ncbi:MAG TPA: type II CRISPR RNA-guided endonuclease Cas9 [Candidatus Aphodovivens excrementavium]|nr:type II CRISPR RNA-guided endonuclease Cas9 [Candidatus Aphodovivens excrementavium]
MNLRDAGKKGIEYNIGLDLGTGSVGWAVADGDGELFHFKGKTTWGSRLFPTAETAASTRVNRGQRRRYARRRWRLDLLQGLFEEEVNKVDPEFFVRLRQSHLLKDDKTYSVALSAKGAARPLFANDEEEVAYYEKYPTIYHLRRALIESDERADIRLIYLAFHNIVKTRGNFLHQDNKNLSASNANMADAVDKLCSALEDWCAFGELECGVRQNQNDIRAILENNAVSPSTTNGLKEPFDPSRASRKDKAAAIAGMLTIEPSETLDAKQVKDASKEIASALFGLQANMKKVFVELEEDQKIRLNNDEQVEAFYDVCPDYGVSLFEALQTVHSAYVLMSILDDANGGTISSCKKAAYDRYKEDLALLKSLVRTYAPQSYDSFFRGDVFDAKKGFRARNYNPATAKGYTKYNAVRGMKYDDFKSEVAKLFKGTSAESDERYRSMMKRFEEGAFLRRLKTSDNGSIPYQLHLEEMEAIIQSQKRFYPFLEENREKLRSLVEFRIPYYVGPLTQKNAAKDAHGNARFAWSVRREGKEGARIYPWNWEEVIDRKQSAAKFMERLTGTCTYLLDEPVLPRNSLLYEEYCVLNELNGARYSSDGDTWYRFSYDDRMGIIEDTFKKKKGSVKYKDVEDWLKCECHQSFAHVRGGQGETGFESKLSSYMFFKDVLRVDEIDEADIPMIEEIIWWNTLFEDRDILRESIEEKYGDRLDAGQIKAICKKRFTGWGRLSKKLLCGIKVATDNGPKSIMDILREGNPNNSARSDAMVFMEIIRDDKLGFSEKIEEENQKLIPDIAEFDINDLPGSPAVRRTVNQAKRIVEEIVSIAGAAPKNIFVEVAREEDGRNKGRRTKRRYDAIKEAIGNLKREHKEHFDKDVADRLNAAAPSDLDDERLALYFMQNGKCLYCGRELDISQLDKYQVDHILPQSYIKDDSFENKALVHSEDNQRKSDTMLLDRGIVRKMRSYWEALHSAGLIGDKKYKNLTRDRVGDKELGGFIARQMVETSQSMKLTELLLEKMYPDTNIRPVKAGFSSDLRKRLGLVKCREVNDFHHAHDAYLACEVGRFISMRHDGLYENPVGYARAVRSYIERQAKYANDHGRPMRTSGLPGSSSFVVSSFLTSGFDAETGEIFQDTWSAEREAARLHSALGRKDCFISRMPEETSGAFWDATIYSPKQSKKKLALPLKKGLDPQKYGSYSSEKFAYFALYEAKTAKGKQQIEFIGVPVPTAREIALGKMSPDGFFAREAEEKGLVFAKALRSRILKYSKICYGDDEYYVPALGAVYSSRQPAFDSNITETAALAAKRQLGSDAQAEKDALALYDELVEKASALCSRFSVVQTAMREGRGKFQQLSMDDKCSLLVSVLEFYKGTKSTVNLSSVEGAPNAGKITNGFIRNDVRNLVFVDQSVTGMFERRTRV